MANGLAGAAPPLPGRAVGAATGEPTEVSAPFVPIDMTEMVLLVGFKTKRY